MVDTGVVTWPTRAVRAKIRLVTVMASGNEDKKMKFFLRHQLNNLDKLHFFYIDIENDNIGKDSIEPVLGYYIRRQY